MLIKKLTSQMLSYSQFLAPKEPLGDTDLDLSVSQKLHLVWPTKCYLEGRSEELQEPCPEGLVDLVTLYFYQFFLISCQYQTKV